MSRPQAEVVTLWFGTGSLCLLTLVLPLDRGLTDGVITKGTNVPSFGVGSVTLLGPSSFLCKRSIGLAVRPAPPCSAVHDSDGERGHGSH